PAEVAAVPGRIFRVENETYSVRDPKMGISVYMADTLLILREKFPKAQCVMNLRSTPKILNACSKEGFRMVDMPTPADHWQRGNEYDSDLKKVIAGTKELPDVITIPDRINLEKLIVVIGTSLEDFERKVLALNAAVAE
ncbi:MAG: thiamine-phosphate synthase family protein, partial [Fibrobacteraceae bacterium]